MKGDPVAATPYSMKSKSKTDEMAALVRSPEVRASSEEKEKSRDAGKTSTGQDQLIVRQAMGTDGEMAARVERLERGMGVMERHVLRRCVVNGSSAPQNGDLVSQGKGSEGQTRSK